MADPQARFEELITRLRERDYRLTPQRVELVRLIAASQGHPSVIQLYEQIQQRFPTMSLATVYKTINLLKELGEVLEINLRDDSHYDGNKPFPHPHLICLKCQKIMDGELGLHMQNLIEELERSSGFAIHRHQLDFYGVCSECRSKQT